MFEDIKEIIRRSKSKKDRQHNGQKKRKNGQKMIYKTLHRKLKINWHTLITYYDVKGNVR